MEVARIYLIITVQLLIVWNSASGQDCTVTNVTDHFYAGGEHVGIFDDQEVCREICEFNSTCVATSWDSDTKWCFQHSSHSPKRIPAKGWILFLFFCPCNDFISQMDNYAAVGGVITPAWVNTSELCEAHCLSMPITDCGSWDFNLDSDRCFVHANTNPIKFRSQRVIHYMRELCINETDCVDTFVPLAGMGGWRGEKQESIGDVRNCKALCLGQSIADCLAFDFNSAEKSCWLFATEPFKYPNSDVTHYTRTECVGQGEICPGQFTKMPSGRAGERGILQTGPFQRPEDCWNACRKHKISECQAIDYNRDDKTCFIFKTLPVLYSNPAVDHYTRKACFPSNKTCDHAYKKTENEGAHGGIMQPDVLKRPLCEKLCNEKANCSSFDFVTDTEITTYESRCFLLDQPEDKLSKYKPGNNAVTHYIKIPCGGETTESPIMTTGMDGCKDTWLEVAGGYRGGVEQAGKMDQDGCQELCRNLTIHNGTCAAIDFRSSDGKCFLFQSVPPEVEKHNARDVKHFTLELCVETSAPPEVTTAEQVTGTEAGCNNRFKPGPGTDKHAYGGTLVEDAITVETCQDRCLELLHSECSSIDFDIANRCYLHAIPSPTLYPGKGGVSHYERDICTTTTVTKAPTAPTPSTMGPLTRFPTLSTLATTRVITQRPSTIITTFVPPTTRPRTTAPRTVVPTILSTRPTTRRPEP